MPEALPAVAISPLAAQLDALAIRAPLERGDARKPSSGEVDAPVRAEAAASDAQLAPTGAVSSSALSTVSSDVVSSDETSASVSASPALSSAASSAPSTPSPVPATAASAAPSPAPSATPSSEPLLNGGYKRPGAANDPTTGYYEEVELEDMEWDPEREEYTYPCPCGDKFVIAKEELLDGEDIARCASCSLLLKVIFDPEDLEEED
jgi:diphthamide biosynthesis protein 3